MDHEFDPGHTGMSDRCNALVMRDGAADDCGLPRVHSTHGLDPWCRGCNPEGASVYAPCAKHEGWKDSPEKQTVVTDENGVVEYGVEIRDSDHPRAEWRFRYGWYAGDEGLARMKESMAYLLDLGVFAARLVRRTTLTEVLDDQSARR